MVRLRLVQRRDVSRKVVETAGSKFETTVMKLVETYGESEDVFFEALDTLGKLPSPPDDAPDDDATWRERDSIVQPAFESSTNRLRRSGVIARACRLALDSTHAEYELHIRAFADGVVKAIDQGEVIEPLWHLIDAINPTIPHFNTGDEVLPVYEELTARFMAAISDAVRANIEMIAADAISTLCET